MRLIVNRDEAQTFIDRLRECSSSDDVVLQLTISRENVDKIIVSKPDEEIVMVWPSLFNFSRS